MYRPCGDAKKEKQIFLSHARAIRYIYNLIITYKWQKIKPNCNFICRNEDVVPNNRGKWWL